jgi:hypothetical protein
MTASPSLAVRDGVSTVDGWSLSFSKVMIGIGHVSLGDGCNSYSEARYDRVLDVTKGSSQKISEQFGIGVCDVRFRVAVPAPDAVLGGGVTEVERTTMRTPGTDPYATDAGVTLLVQGAASRADVTKTFLWSFRQAYRYEKCNIEVDGKPVEGVNLISAQALTYDIWIAAERLFRDDILEATALLRFDPFAAADANGDGEITLAELGKVPLSKLQALGPYRTVVDAGDGGDAEADGSDEDANGVDAGGPDVQVADSAVVDADDSDAYDPDAGDAGPRAIRTLEDYVYNILMPTLPRFRDIGKCSVLPGLGGHHD